MSLAKGLIIVGLAVGGYLLYTKFVSNNPAIKQGLDSTMGVGSVVLSAIGNAGVSDAAIKEFVQTHDYGAFTRDVLNQNAKQAAQAQPVFASRAAANAYYSKR